MGFPKFIKLKHISIKRYDSKTNFNLLNKLSIKSITSIRKNASDKTKKCKSKNEHVNMIKKTEYEEQNELINNTV